MVIGTVSWRILGVKREIMCMGPVLQAGDRFIVTASISREILVSLMGSTKLLDPIALQRCFSFVEDSKDRRCPC